MSLSESATYPNEAYGPIRGDTMGTAGAVPDTSIPTMGGKRNSRRKSKKNTGGKRNERKSKKNTGGKRNERKSRRNQRNSKRNHRK
jgi:hypothetical protein